MVATPTMLWDVRVKRVSAQGLAPGLADARSASAYGLECPAHLIQVELVVAREHPIDRHHALGATLVVHAEALALDSIRRAV